ncbi:hypothetical protein NVP1210O_01, partial [Vibrio phage 1.210.O._10N.222.52.C2]
MARPTIFSQEVANSICKELADGTPLREICRDDDKPALSTVLMWVVNNKDGFMEQYRNARTAQAHHDADKLRSLAEMVVDGDIEPQQAKVAIDVYKWTAERNAAKVYGPKQEIDHTSSDKSMSPKGFNAFYDNDDEAEPESES